MSGVGSLSSQSRVAILLHGGLLREQGKTGLSLLRYGQFQIVAVIDREQAGGSLPELTGIPKSIPIVASVAEALAYQPQVLVIGIAPSGGQLPQEWREEVGQALRAGLSLVNGLHTPMAGDPQFQEWLQPGAWIWDIRQEPQGLSVGKALARTLPCKRVLTVGTDMSVGKMSTSLELHQASLRRGLRSRFLATGQTGIMLSGDGIPLDAVRVDYASGAVEQGVLRYGSDCDILHIEGQGSLLNPASTATLPLLRGSQPTHLILVHRAGQTHIKGMDYVPIPPLPKVIELYEQVAGAGGAFASVRVAGIALNTFGWEETAALEQIRQVEAETGLPCVDVVRFGADPLLEEILAGD
ncbi:DUF1611 domain-containing protein [Thermostichus vulcanus]|uniref:DUF1611 domain-containing protein n=1 Tax=Thermostichus vulcanus str. 'Rupite' TaxID=2813851 RepID=A0ABT0CAC1_THEVL|nr:DUF1611 domain-containing protein [Thermostichus vulcanus]MCJ2542696.1 DUF1611 domain-containing protein [Thermostichus vulcanus str. 'Rupite']